MKAARLPAVTLIELLVVLCLLGVIASLIVPRMSRSLERRELDEATARFVQTARTVRELAISGRRTWAIELDLDQGAYGVSMQSGRTPGGEWRAVQASWLKNSRWPSSIKIESFKTPQGLTASRGVQRISFLPDGTSSGAAILLVTEHDRRTIVVHPHNGRAVYNHGQATLSITDQYNLGD